MEASIAQDAVPNDIEERSTEAILEWVGDTFGNGAGFASSFSPEDVVVIDLLARLNSPIRIFTLDTGRLHEETYRVMEAIRDRYKIDIEVVFPQRDKVEKLVGSKGLYSFYKSLENRKECCGIRKIEPLNRVLAGLDAWLTGLRREQSQTRVEMKKVEIDEAHNSIYKINPLIDWSEKEVWDYIAKYSVPYNELFDRGFKSVGCSPCTRAVRAIDGVRAGRWWWENPESKECGLHK